MTKKKAFEAWAADWDWDEVMPEAPVQDRASEEARERVTVTVRGWAAVWDADSIIFNDKYETREEGSITDPPFFYGRTP